MLPFTFHIYDSWIISSYHLYLSGLDKYHQLNKQALSWNKQDLLHCDHLCQALAFLENQIKQILVSLSYSMDYIYYYLIICVKILLNHIQKYLGKNHHVQVKRKFQKLQKKEEIKWTKWALKCKIWGINVEKNIVKFLKLRNWALRSVSIYSHMFQMLFLQWEQYLR